MAQSASKNCDICVSAPGIEYCLNCEQYFCTSCKSLHKRQNVSKNHEFQDGSNLIQEIICKCKEHNEEFIFLCTTCEGSVCRRCAAGKHRGHEFSNIDDSIQELKEVAEREMNSRRDIATKNLLKMEQGLDKFDSDIISIIKSIRENGSRIKTMVDKEVEKIVTAVNDQARREKEKLSTFKSSAKELIDATNALENRLEKLQKDRENASLIQKLKVLNNDMSRLQISSVPVFPTVGYSSKSMTDIEIANLLGSFSLCETKATQLRNPGAKTSLVVQEEEKQTGYLYRCVWCGREELKKTKTTNNPTTENYIIVDGEHISYQPTVKGYKFNVYETRISIQQETVKGIQKQTINSYITSSSRRQLEQALSVLVNR